MPRPLRPLVVGCVSAFVLGGVAFAATATGTALPLALREVDPAVLSGGLFAALDAQGAFGFRPPPARAAAGAVDLSKGRPPAALDVRVGVNVRLGADPDVLPAAQRGQAEPHIYRSAANPDVLLATFQDGRYAAGGGAFAVGYAISRDGGLSWTRGIVPELTPATGGPYFRATDPVAAAGPNGELYLNCLASIDNAFGLAAVVVSRSLDNGVTWSSPLVAFQSPNAQTAPDKNWLAVNDFATTPFAGRLVATWTNFTSNAQGATTGYNLVATLSSDRGLSWTPPVDITPVGSTNQGTQPVFLPDGSLAVVYVTFLNSATQFSINCKLSTNGGVTFPANATTVVPLVVGWDDPQLRDGVFLPSATVARQTGEIFVTYTAVVLGSPRVMVTKSSDRGATWSTPVAASNQPAGVSVMNPAIAVTPDGRTVSVVFMDKRLAPDGQNFVDHFLAQSFDGGLSWQPNTRLSEMSSDIRYAALTSGGYMIGDYLGVAPSLASDQPCVAIWCDTRSGDADPMTVRFTPSDTPDYGAWARARFTRQELTTPGSEGRGDFDNDNFPNTAEFFFATNPRVPESGEAVYVENRPESVDFGWAIRESGVSDIRQFAVNLADNSSIQSFFAPPLPINPVSLPNGLVWSARRVPVASAPLRLDLAALVPNRGTAVQVIVESTYTRTSARLVNLSTRGQLLAGASQLIGSLVTRGADRTLLFRGVGPTLNQFVPSLAVAADPTLRLVNIDGTNPVTNNDWGENGTAARAALSDAAVRVGAFPFGNDREAALLATRPAGAYSAMVTRNATTGASIGLVEIYDASTNANGQMVNLSTRGEVGAGDAALIAGVVIGGTQPRRVLIRAVGPSLARFNVGGALLADPVLTLYLGQVPIATNDDWEISRSSAALAATAVRVGAFALDPASLDAALLITLIPGAYTAIVTSADGGTGIALVEIYDAD